MRSVLLILLVAGAAVLQAPRQSAADVDVFMLQSGGRVLGELINSDELPRKTYLIKTLTGGKITLTADQVKSRMPQRPEDVEYEKRRFRCEDTAAAQFELAQWCSDNNLRILKRTHLQRVIELEPDHKDARRMLGYFRKGDRWTTTEREMLRRGMIRHKGRWLTAQEIKLLKGKEKQKTLEGEWYKKIAMWHKWLGGKRSQLAEQNLLTINDSAAVLPLARALQDEPREGVKILFVKALMNIGTPNALSVVAKTAIEGSLREVRLTCLDYLQELTGDNKHYVANYFVPYLGSKDNTVINRAGIALGYMKDPSTAQPLINALVTVHRRLISKGGGMSPSFSSGTGGSSGGLSMGGGPKYIKETYRNEAVLEALVTIAGGVNFQYNIPAWQQWYLSQKKDPPPNGRRD